MVAQKFVVKEARKRKSPSDAVENPGNEAIIKKGGGRRKGTKNWKKQELTRMLELVEEHTPCRAKQWDQVAVELYDAGYKDGRSGKVCKKKFDKLWQTPRPTGSPEVPFHVQRAKDIKEKISRVECMARASLNDPDSDDNDDENYVEDEKEKAMKGAQILDQDGNRRPLTRKMKQNKMVDSINELGKQTERNTNQLCDVLKNITSPASSDPSPDVSKIRNEVGQIKSELSELKSKLDKQFKTIIAKLSGN